MRNPLRNPNIPVAFPIAVSVGTVYHIYSRINTFFKTEGVPMCPTTQIDTQNYRKSQKGQSFDHSLMPPCQAACPLHMEIREYLDLIAQGKVMEALKVIRDGNPFPSICAHVCTHPCEENCRRAQVDKPLAIRALKKFAVEFGADRMIEIEAETKYDDKVAVVGSGPAGMGCAHYLRKIGYPVTIFEAYSELGGMLRVGIPQYRLPREVLDNEIQRLVKMGVEIRTNTRVSSLDLLFEMEYKAIFLTIGAHQSLRLGIDGEDTPGVIDGATYLREVNLGIKPELGDDVIVVGGGNVAIDAARTAVRLGAKRVSILYRRSREEMPADAEEIEQALQEGIEITYLAAPVCIERRDGQLGVICIKMELGEPDSSGRRKPTPIQGSEFIETWDTVITAIGQAPQVPKDFNLRIGRGSTIQVDPITLTTTRAGVFAGGDAVTGPATVTEALATGRRAALHIDDYLQHRYPQVDNHDKETLSEGLLLKTSQIIKKADRMQPEVISPKIRTRDFRPVEMVYSWADAVTEARRCLRCGMGAEILFQDKCATCLTCLRVCPYNVPYLDETGTIQIPADQCQACGICVTECPAGAIVLRRPYDRSHIIDELEHAFRSAEETRSSTLIIGFCCQYGLYGTGALAGFWRQAIAGVRIVPVLCVAKVEAQHILHAFERGAAGVFVAGCGEMCARDKTAFWVNQQIEKVKKVLNQLELGSDRLQFFDPCAIEEDPATVLDRFTQRVSELYLDTLLKQEVRSDSR